MRDSFRKLDPRVQLRNPVMFVVFVGSILTTVIGIASRPAWPMPDGAAGLRAGDRGVAVADGAVRELRRSGGRRRGKAQAATLRSMRRDVQAQQAARADELAAVYEKVVEPARCARAICCGGSAGELIPADGEIIEGVASVNESAVTGESAPVLREAGGDFSSVTGGTRVLSDWIVVRVSA